MIRSEPSSPRVRLTFGRILGFRNKMVKRNPYDVTKSVTAGFLL